MTEFDSTPMPFDHQRRRSGERRLDTLANNSLLKVAQFLITSLAVPLIGWGASALGKIQEQLQLQDKTTAITELRLLSAEKALAQAAIADQAMRERVLTLELQLRGIATAPKGQQ